MEANAIRQLNVPGMKRNFVCFLVRMCCLVEKEPNQFLEIEDLKGVNMTADKDHMFVCIY